MKHEDELTVLHWHEETLDTYHRELRKRIRKETDDFAHLLGQPDEQDIV